MTESLNMEVLENLLANRWSCRGYTDEPVPPTVIKRLVSTAGRMPSWCNTQPWQVHVTSTQATITLREAMAADDRMASDLDFPQRYEGIHRERRRESGWQLYHAVGVAQGDRESSAIQTRRNFEFFDAPHVAIITSPKSLGVYGAIDCGLFIGSFLLAVEALGLGACAQAALALKSDLLRERLVLPESCQVVCGISLGYPDMSHPTNSYRTSRAPLSEYFTWAD